MNIASDDDPLPRQCQSRTKTTYQIARPPPISSSRRRLRIRPRLLLQLQQLSDHSRPTPALDVLPSSVLPARVGQRVPKIFRTRQLGPNDILVTTADSTSLQLAQDCDVSSNSSDESEKWENREMVGVICRPRRSESGDASGTVCLDNGDTWCIAQLPRGGYEFTRTDKEGELMRVRWMPKEKPRSRTGISAGMELSEPNSSPRCVFSILNAGVRKHPVIATLTKDRIEIQDSYAESVPQSPIHSACSPSTSVHITEAYFEETFESAPRMIQTDHHLRSLIIMTGLHVFFQEDWPKAASDGAVLRYTSMTAGLPPPPGQAATKPQARRAVSSINIGTSHSKLARANTVGTTLASTTNTSRIQPTRIHMRSVSETMPSRLLESDAPENRPQNNPQLLSNHEASSQETASGDTKNSAEASSGSRGTLDKTKATNGQVLATTKPGAGRARKRSRFRRLLDKVCFNMRSQRVRT